MADATSLPSAGFTMPRPDDFHLHLRDGPEMASVLGRESLGAALLPSPRPPRAAADRLAAAIAVFVGQRAACSPLALRGAEDRPPTALRRA